MSFQSFGLESSLINEAAAAGFTEPTSFQSLAIPPALSGKDVLGRTNGNPGKAEAFILPLLQHVSRNSPGGEEPMFPRALILAPTRKATQEVQAATLRYGRQTTVRVIGIFGGVDIEKQIRLLRRRTDVVVATPGRLLDHIARGSVNLSQVGFLVIDESDKMVEMGLIRDVRKIIDGLQAPRQTMVFAGALSDEVLAFAGGILREPVTVDVEEDLRPKASTRQRFYSARRETRIRMLLQLLETESMRHVIVISRTDYEADRITRILKGKGIASQAVRPDWTHSQQEQAYTGMKNGKIRVLVGTNQIVGQSGGKEIDHLINYDFPREEATTAAGSGTLVAQRPPTDTITFVTDDDRAELDRIEQSTGQRVVVMPFPRKEGRRMPEGTAQKRKNDGGRKMFERKPQPVHKKTTPPKNRKKNPIVFARRKKPVKKMETFSSDLGGAGWSGY
ncbi:MAG: DEAD/DEAH box helicase [Bacteroidota bacterium]